MPRKKIAMNGRAVVAILVVFSITACAAPCPIRVGCSGATRGDWRTPIRVHVDNPTAQRVVSFEIAVYDVDDHGQQISGYSQLRFQAAIEPGAHVDLKYPNNPILYLDNKVNLPPRYRNLVRGVGCDTLEVHFADGSTWQKPGPYL